MTQKECVKTHSFYIDCKRYMFPVVAYLQRLIFHVNVSTYENKQEV